MSLQDHYPQSCPFCRIAAAYPPEASPVPSNPDPEKVSPECFLIYSSEHVMAFLDILPISPGHILVTTRDHYRTLGDMHDAGSQEAERTGLWQGSSRNSSTSRSSSARETSRALGEALPLISRALCRATGIEDWNVVQNNGERAAQVVPHVHFHLIPRYQEGRGNRVAGGKGNVDVGMLKSWRMFGRGTREELDEGEAAELAETLRRELKGEMEGARMGGGREYAVSWRMGGRGTGAGDGEVQPYRQREKTHSAPAKASVLPQVGGPRSKKGGKDLLVIVKDPERERRSAD